MQNIYFLCHMIATPVAAEGIYIFIFTAVKNVPLSNESLSLEMLEVQRDCGTSILVGPCQKIFKCTKVNVN